MTALPSTVPLLADYGAQAAPAGGTMFDDKIEQLLRRQVCSVKAESVIVRQDPNAEIMAKVAWIPSVGFDVPFEATRIRSRVWT